jgi:TonB family protein
MIPQMKKPNVVTAAPARCRALLPAIVAAALVACATTHEPLQTCTQQETNDWARRNVLAIAKAGSTYPQEAAAAGISGVVRLAVDFGAAGTRHQVSVVESSGHAVLDQAALARLQQARLSEPVCGGSSTNVRVIMPMVFDIQDAR